MTQPGLQLPADQVVAALSDVHAEIQAKLAGELAQLRVVVRLRDEEIAYLRTLVPADPAAG